MQCIAHFELATKSKLLWAHVCASPDNGRLHQQQQEHRHEVQQAAGCHASTIIICHDQQLLSR
jgi:hypothetical protein